MRILRDYIVLEAPPGEAALYIVQVPQQLPEEDALDKDALDNARILLQIVDFTR
jgi:hypothetical protein